MNTLKDEKEKYISRLSQEIKDLKTQLNQKNLSSLNFDLNKDQSTSTCSR